MCETFSNRKPESVANVVESRTDSGGCLPTFATFHGLRTTAKVLFFTFLIELSRLLYKRSLVNFRRFKKFYAWEFRTDFKRYLNVLLQTSFFFIEPSVTFIRSFFFSKSYSFFQSIVLINECNCLHTYYHLCMPKVCT